MRVEPPPLKHPYQGNIRWAFFKWADIPDARDESRVYLRRLRVIQTPLFALYLHFIYLCDEDRDPHDHPANFWSLIVRGGYREIVFDTDRLKQNNDWHSWTKEWRRFSLHKMPLNHAHRIYYLKPGTITLCWFGRRQREWGFWTAEGFVNYKDYDRAGEGADPWGA